jgi:hypothetical protein
LAAFHTVCDDNPDASTTLDWPPRPNASAIDPATTRDDAGSTRLDYLGELGTDYWQLGRWWGDQVARKWEATVWGSRVRIRDEAERRTATGLRDRKGR